MTDTGKSIFRATTTEGDKEQFCFVAKNWTDAAKKAEDHCKDNLSGFLDKIEQLDSFVE